MTINANKPNPIKNQIISLRNAFLYILIVLMPTGIFYLSLARTIDEKFESKREQKFEQLNRQSAFVADLANPNVQFKDFFDEILNSNLQKQSQEDILAFIEHLDSLYPNGFRWLIWDENFTEIPLTSSSIIEGRRAWLNYFESFICNDASSNKNFQARVQRAKTILSHSVGNPAKLNELQNTRTEPVKLEWLGRESMAIWGQFAPDCNSGILLIARLDFIEENAWLRRFVNKSHKKNLAANVAVIDISNRSFIATPSEFTLPIDEVIDSYVNRSQNIFRIGKYVVRASPAGIDTGVRILSFIDFSELEKKEKQEIVFTRQIAFSIVFLLSFLAISTYIDSQTIFAIRQRVFALILIALILPLAGYINFTWTLVNSERERITNSKLTELKNELDRLELAFNTIATRLSTTLFFDLKKLLPPGDFCLEQLESAMLRAIDKSLITDFVVLNAQGKIVKEGSNVDFPEEVLGGLRITARIAADDEKSLYKEGNQKIAALSPSIRNNIKKSQLRDNFYRPTRLARYSLMDTTLYIMGISTRINETTYITYIYMQASMLESLFAQEWFAENSSISSFSDITDISGVQTFFYSTDSGSLHLPQDDQGWQKIENSLERVSKENFELFNHTIVNDNLVFYLARPVQQMHSKNFIPVILTSAEEITKRQFLLRKRFVFMLLLIISSAVFLSLILAKNIINPVTMISEGLSRVVADNYNIDFPKIQAEEMHRLALTVKYMLKRLSERQKMQSYVSTSVLEATCDETVEKKLVSGAGVDISVLFVCICDFNQLIKKETPGTIFTILNQFFAGAEPIITSKDGVVDKFIGNTLMAIFQKPVGDMSYADCAVKTAKYIMGFAERLNKKNADSQFPQIKLALGIGSGRAIMGNVGSDERKDLTVIGDCVNLASRLQKMAEEQSVSSLIISEATNSMLNKDYKLTEYKTTTIKGKQKPVKTYIFKLKSKDAP